MKRPFNRIFIPKSKKFTHALTYIERDGVILEVDKNEEWFVAMVHYKFDEIRGNEGASAPSLVLVRRKDLREVANMKLVVDMEGSEILLGDFNSKVEDKGYGSILIQNLVKLARELGIKRINGNLSPVDSDHFDKLKYLYSKYGFKVSIVGDSGSILLEV